MCFFCESLQCSGFFVVDEAEGLASCASVDRMRLCQMGAAAVLWVSMGSPRVHGLARTEVRGDQAVVGCSRKTQSMGSCDVHVLPESFTSFKQRGRI